MIEKSRDGTNSAMLDLQQELRSLKTLLLSTSGKSTTLPGSPSQPPSRPTIPAWQLAPSSGQHSTVQANSDSESSERPDV